MSWLPGWLVTAVTVTVVPAPVPVVPVVWSLWPGVRLAACIQVLVVSSQRGWCWVVCRTLVVVFWALWSPLAVFRGSVVVVVRVTSVRSVSLFWCRAVMGSGRVVPVCGSVVVTWSPT